MDSTRPAPPITASSDATAAPVDRGRRTALVVDHEATSRTMLASMMRGEGFDVVAVEGGRAALAACDDRIPDIVLLDVRMPDLDGYEVARILKSRLAERFVPIIFLTGISDEEALSECVAHRVLDDLVGGAERLAPDLSIATSTAAAAAGSIVLAGHRPNGARVVLLASGQATGLAAAVTAIPLASTFASVVEKGFGVARIVSRLDARLREFGDRAGSRHLSVVEVDPVEFHLRAWNGGTVPILVRRAATGQVRRIVALDRPLGTSEPVNLSDGVQLLEFAEGDRVLLASERTVNAASDGGEPYGIDRVERAFAANEAPGRFVDELVTTIDAHAGGRLGAEAVVAQIHPRPGGSGPAITESSAAHLRPEPDAAACRARFEFGPHALAGCDPLPGVNQFVSSLPGLESHAHEIFLIVSELFYNALDHGLLGLDSAIKSGPEGFARYYTLRDARRSELTEGRVSIAFRYAPTERGGTLRIEVEDSGPGFDWAATVDRGFEGNETSCGRGIPIVRSLCREFRYLGSGNRVRAVYAW